MSWQRLSVLLNNEDVYFYDRSSFSHSTPHGFFMCAHSMRVTTDFFASVLLRQLRAAGSFAYLVRRGAHEAGALFILHYHQSGRVDLYGPAPQSLYLDENGIGDRLFIRLVDKGGEDEARAKVEKELDFDPDLWLIEIENFCDDLTQMIRLVDETIS